MKICIIAEGSYPYVTGGVSSWIQMLMANLPEHEFIIYAIGAEEKNRGKFVYEKTENLTDIEEIFLDTFLQDKGHWGKRIKITDEEQTALKKLLSGENFNWEILISLLLRIDSATDLILSKSFYDILTEAYKERYPQTSFVDYFWAVRSMVLPLFNLIKTPIPEADLYHSVSTGYAGVVAMVAKYLYKKPFVLTEHGIYTREREEEIIKSQWIKGYFKDMWNEFFYNLSKGAYDSADKVITLFEKNKEIEMEIGCSDEKIEIIPNGVNVNKFTELYTKDQKEDYINIGAIIRVVPIKDIKTMIQAFAIVKSEVSNARFYIIGPYDEDKEYYEECRNMVEQLQIEDVVFTGKVNIKEYMSMLDILVLTSISEGQPLALLEGMASKKPYVTTDVGSCRELLLGKDDLFGEAGIVAPVMSYIKVAQGIIKLCQDKQLRVEMGQNGYNRVSVLYTEERFIGSYRKLYSRLGGE